jgi:hypothetical protein
MSANLQLQDAAKAMVTAAEQGRPVVPVLKKLCPHIHRQIVQDSRFPGLLSLWGRSVNVDENAGQVIVHPAILQAIGELAGVPMRGRIVHAGLQHTYGYLFSLIDTPYGAKRDRWVSTELERGFGLDLSLLGDRPRAGTLLANLTWFLGQIAYRGRPRCLRQLQGNAPAVAPALLDNDFARVPVSRIEEQAIRTGKTSWPVWLFTDLVPFPNPPADPGAENALLIYSVQTGARSPLKLITAFPIRPDVARQLQAAVPTRGHAEVRLRYNAYVPGLFGRTVTGWRRLVPLPG